MKPPETRQQIPQRMLQDIVQLFRDSKLSQKNLGDAIGMKESAVCKIMLGNQTSMSAKSFRLMEIALGKDLIGIEKNGNPSIIATKAAAMIDSDPIIAKLAVSIMDAIAGAQATFTPRYVPTEEMSAMGRKIIKIVTDNPDKPGKVAKMVLQLLN